MMQVCMPSKKYPDTNIQLSVLMHGGSKTACVLSVCHENKSRGFDNKYSFVNKAYFRQSSSGKHFIWLPNKHSETNWSKSHDKSIFMKYNPAPAGYHARPKKK